MAKRREHRLAPEKGARLRLDCHARPAHAGGRARQTRGIETEWRQKRECAPRLHALKTHILIAWIVDRRETGFCNRREKPRPRHAEKRPHEANRRIAAGQHPHRRHGGKPVDTAAARKAQEKSLRLIFKMMRDEKVARTGLAARPGEKRIARIARRRLQTAGGLGPPPCEDAVGHAELAGKPRRLFCFSCGFRP